jgi:uncharacterized membrane protein SirB2
MNAVQTTLLVHIAAVLASVTLLALRAAHLLAEQGPVPRVLGIAPGIADLLLVLSAATLCVLIGQYPFQQPWLTGKLLGLLAYTGTAHAAAGAGRSRGARLALYSLALVALAYTIAVALRGDPTPW